MKLEGRFTLHGVSAAGENCKLWPGGPSLDPGTFYLEEDFYGDDGIDFNRSSERKIHSVIACKTTGNFNTKKIRFHLNNNEYILTMDKYIKLTTIIG